jgi:hypothetical protein
MGAGITAGRGREIIMNHYATTATPIASSRQIGE